ncbi:hypothetical protein DERF_004295 [Dermatophagoides farinae]|uniref:Uncharacterized protein n=1 Tax=Dermatophagoides farinae TaxID=6954 RepID=A0A922I713_DERFA|nr:hypothetical protein DERF_004295 [Dermatophagoides farinae]
MDVKNVMDGMAKTHIIRYFFIVDLIENIW